MVPTEASARVSLEFKNGFIEFPVAAVLVNVFKIDLRRYDHEHAKEQGNK